MNKTVMLTIKKEYSWIEIDHEVSAYERITFQNDVEKMRVEGLALTKDLENANADTDSIELKKNVGERFKPAADLISKDFLEVIRKRPIYLDETLATYRSMVEDKPYSFLKEHSFENMMFIYMDYGNHHFWDHEGNSIPRAIHFDYMNGSIDNGSYDLEKVLEYLKSRNDIDWDKSGPKIQSIPYYNVDGNTNEYLDFYWMPSDEDFKKVVPYIKKPFEFRMFIIKEILGLKDFYIPKEYEIDNE